VTSIPIERYIYSQAWSSTASNPNLSLDVRHTTMRQSNRSRSSSRSSRSNHPVTFRFAPRKPQDDEPHLLSQQVPGVEDGTMTPSGSVGVKGRRRRRRSFIETIMFWNRTVGLASSCGAELTNSESGEVCRGGGVLGSSTPVNLYTPCSFLSGAHA
jgi:hypothetical protein